jgi:hypothetical protein
MSGIAAVSTSVPPSSGVGYGKEIVDLARYPVDDLASAAAREVIAAGRAQLAKNGLCLLPDFIAPSALSQMCEEARSFYPTAYYEEQADTHDGSGRLEGFAMPRKSRSAASAVAYDRIPASSPLRRLYEWDGLVGLVRALLGVDRLYRTADPLISCLLMYYSDGDELGWHFDPNDGVVTLLLQAPDEGGQFEFVPGIRRDNEESRAAIARVMDGAREGVLTPPLLPGTLSIFRGTNSLHRVTPVKGSKPRAILTLSFDPEPGVMFSAEIRRRYSGRVN